MFFWNMYPFVRLSIALILGVVCYDRFARPWEYPEITLIAGFLTYCTCVFLSHKFSFYKLRHLNGLLALLLVFCIGGYRTQFNYHQHDPLHYKNLNVKIEGFSGAIISPPSVRQKYERYDFEIDQVVAGDSLLQTHGTIHLYIRKDSLVTPFAYGSRLTIYGKFFPVSPPNNPAQFDYKSYLSRQNIYAQAFVENQHVLRVGYAPKNRLFEWAYALRNHSTHTIDEHMKHARENGVAKALLLGIKDHLDNDLKRAYSSAGVMHVLAVSGLHVGIIFLIVKIIFGRLKHVGKWGKYLFGFIGVSIVWIYAVVTGLSPSVLRAAIMFSIITVSEASSRETNIYNSLGLAAFVLILLDPYIIYSVGFQLSFAAVTGIVYLQPRLYHLIDLRWYLLDKVWMITCVSLAAQISTFPLIAYYFHQFPTYFLLSNLVVIPASFIMLLAGISMLILDPIWESAARIIGLGLQHLMWMVNEVINSIHTLPNSLIEWIYMDKISVILTYLIAITLIVGLHYQLFKTVLISSCLLLVYLSHNVIINQSQSLRKELIFYEITDHLAIDHIHGHSAKLYIDNYSEDDLALLSSQIDPFRLASHLKPIDKTIETFDLAGFHQKNVIRQGSIAAKRLIVFDSTTFHLEFKQTIDTDYIIINNGAIKSLAWLKDHFTFDLIIIGPKNSIYYSRKMRKQADELGLKLHSLKEDGSLRISL